MITATSSRYAKAIATFFMLTLYSQWLLAAHFSIKEYSPGYYNNNSLMNNTHVINSAAGLPGIFTGPSPISIAAVKDKNSSDRKSLSPKEGKSTLTGGPTQPEMQSFQSVNTSNMVDLFTGDFSYNIPLMDVGGYPINLHYQGGITMDQDASWVGLGWNINPGNITRNMRGLPDDFNGTDKVDKTISMKDDRTVGVTAGANVELLGVSLNSDIDNLKLNAGISLGVFNNTYRGWGVETGLNAGINAGIGSKGSLSGGLGITNNSQGGLTVSPTMSYQLDGNEHKTRGSVTIGTNYNSRMGIENFQVSGQIKQQVINEKKFRLSEGSGITSYISFATPSYTPSIRVPFTSSQFTFTAKVGIEQWGLDPNFYLRGYVSKQTIKDADKNTSMPAYGYLYYQETKGDANVLLDFNREKDVAYREEVPHIAIPSYTYDTYSISGEGNGGMFRPYRSDIGFIYDHALTTKSNSNAASIDVGFGNVLHAGVDFYGVYASTKNKPWLGDNIFKDYAGFKTRDSIYENVYFKNPGEKTMVDQKYFDAIGDANLVRVDLDPLNGQNARVVTASQNLSVFSASKLIGKVSLDKNTYRSQRDKRTQVISYLTATEASTMGLDKIIKSYNINSFPSTTCNTNYETISRIDPVTVLNKIRQPHHISEMQVLNGDGRRYVYGLPVYNLNKSEVSFATMAGKGSLSTGLTDYTPGTDNSTSNNNGKDGYFNRERLPAYTHAFLLTGILSPDYVDVTGDGITEDDPGEAIKFNYTRVYGIDTSNRYKWRAPFDQAKAAYNEGLKTDNRDERGSYTYGEKEIWYLNSIESKTMIATFRLDTDSTRLDGYGAIDENGGIDNNKKLYRVKQIDLYSKADYLKNGTAAKPIKSVFFEYDYSLCPGTPNSRTLNGQNTGKGKLTLKKVWFTYNNNNKGKLNPYQFTYSNLNPTYGNASFDRWGNYKSAADNPAQLNNADYSYALQGDSTKAALNASAWNLTGIKLPSGGQMAITYEADDYAYVQNRRAMQFFTLAGFGATSTATPAASLFPNKTAGRDYQYVFINVSDAVSTKDDIARKYLDGVSKLFFKLLVRMPDDKWGKGSEFVPCYADILDYGVTANSSGKVIWVKVAAVKGNSPFATAAIQFLRLNLPSKAYPYSEPGDNLDFKSAVKMIATAATNISDAVRGFENNARRKNWGSGITLSSSFVRLDNPGYKKFGGGLRVKRIQIYDNWNAMTGQKESVYGQEYDYSTTKDINGVSTRISSGVATYEPGIGNDENPFHLPIEYVEKINVAGPTNFMYTEEPMAESYFPAPSVGYSRVRVQTIHKDKKSANGLDETNFYTSYDFPVITEFTPLDNETKKTFNPAIANLFKFFAKHYVTLSQGFKIELNDMNGKLKSQASYAQTDLKTPISYTENYYKLDKDQTLSKHLSNKVDVADSANGVITQNAQIGKDIEIMVDVREQTSSTFSGSVEANADWVNYVPPIVLGSVIPLPSSEINRYRSIAVMKVVQRYGILDSVVHIEKGSVVSTKNMIYDGETGDVLLSRTNNEFNDPVYNFNYPAHWAYTGMGPAYKNMGAVFSGLGFKSGKLVYSDGTDFPVSRYFESGDEIMVTANDNRLNLTTDICNPLYYIFSSASPVPKKIWAIDASKGKEGNNGIYFIDRDGIPYSAVNASLKIIRSGKRNMPSTPVGAITSLQNPLKLVSGVTRFVFDTTTNVIAASAAQFKDFWRVDSSLYAKDTTVMASVLAPLHDTIIYPAKQLWLERWGRDSKATYNWSDKTDYMVLQNYDYGTGKRQEIRNKEFMLFDFSQVPSNAIVISAGLNVFAHKAYHNLFHDRFHLDSNAHYNNTLPGKNNNQSVLKRLTSWPAGNIHPIVLAKYFEGGYSINTNAAVFGPTTPAPNSSIDYSYNNQIPCTALVQDMLNARATTQKIGMSMELSQYQSEDRMCFFSGYITKSLDAGHNFKYDVIPFLSLKYYTCIGGSTPTFSDGIYSCTSPKDTFLCKPNINDTATNPYRWGILGNWRMNRAYTYFNKRKEIDPAAATNIRKDGAISNFSPYWSFGSTLLQAVTDTSRWVWNSEMSRFNRKGYEIENDDPLNRYNAGQYGYNQTLPVAVGQNTKNREMVFDGFEDYNYKTDTCKRCQTLRFADFSSGGGTLVDTISHTGKYSLRIAGNSTATTAVSIDSYTQDTAVATLSAKLDTTIITNTVVTGKGTGLQGNYTDWADVSCHATVIDPTINFDWGSGAPFAGCPSDNFRVVWTGKIQPRFTDDYTFYTQSDDGIRVTVNGVVMIDAYFTQHEELRTSKTIRLTAGALYSIKVEYFENKERASARLFWSSGKQVKEIVPKSQLYPPNMVAADSAGSVQVVTTYCIKLNNPKVTNIMNKRFSPLQGTKVLVSAWVKEDAVCASGNYTGEKIQLNFTGGTSLTVNMIPTGNIIEGWQRIEDTVTIPSAATTMSVVLSATSSTAVYFDDIRIHPFNSNMKSFVYHPVNIRLMAELDENNYATFYEYDDDGTLIRVKKETERGIKTIKETRSALLKL